MDTHALDLRPRCRLVPLSPHEATGLLRSCNLGDDPFDPRQALALGAQGFLRWLEEEDEARREEGQTSPAAALPWESRTVRADWPAELSRPGWLLELDCHNHCLALFVVSRREDSDAPAPYALPTTWLTTHRPEAVCFTYLQVKTSSTEEPGVSILLDGWLGMSLLERVRQEEVNGAPLVRIDRSSLRPMHELFDLLQQPPASAPAPPVIRPAQPPLGKGNWTPLLAGLTLFSMAIALVLGLLLWLRPARVEEVERPTFAFTVVETGLATEALRAAGPATPVVHSGQKYTFRVRAATPLPFGRLFNIDSRGVTPLETLQRQADGALGAEHRDAFGRTPGWEYFATVLSDREFPSGKEATWLDREQLEQLQRLGDANNDEAARDLLRKALARAGLEGARYEVRLARFKHE